MQQGCPMAPIILILETIGVDLKKLEFVKGSELQLNKNYFNDLLKLSTMTSINDAKHAAAEVVKLGEILRCLELFIL